MRSVVDSTAESSHSNLVIRPRSFKGGDLHWIWSPYSIYQNVRNTNTMEWDCNHTIDRLTWFTVYAHTKKWMASPMPNVRSHPFGSLTVRNDIPLALDSFHERCRNDDKSHIPLPRACCAVASRSARGIHRSESHARQNHSVLVAGVLLRLLQDWTQYDIGLVRVLDYS